MKFCPISDPIPHTVPKVIFYFILVVTSRVIFGFALRLAADLTFRVTFPVAIGVNSDIRLGFTPFLTP